MVNDETSMRNPDLSTRIYLTATNVEKCRLLSENTREKEEAKRKQKRRQPPKIFIIKKSDLEIFRNARTP